MTDLNVYLQKLRSDHRHIICTAITLVSLACGFLFPNSLPRVAESVRDLATSFAYYVCELLELPLTVRPTVMDMPSWQFAPTRFAPLDWLPATWEEFAEAWSGFFEVFFDLSNFTQYLDLLANIVYYTSRISMILAPVIVIVILKLRSYANKRCNDRHKSSKQLQRFEHKLFTVAYPAIAYVKDFVAFLRANPGYPQAWLAIWLLHFNVYAILISFFAFYFFFAATWDLTYVYTQLLKLMHDLAPMVRFVPLSLWLTFGAIVYNYVCRSMAFNRLYYYESANRSFLRQRGIVTTVYGVMGVGKTQMVTSMALSSEIEHFDQAFEIMLEQDLKFPNFPWQNLRDELKKQIDAHGIVDIPSCRAYVRKARRFFDYVTERYSPEEWQNRRRELKLRDYTFGYDYDHYRIDYNDELKITHLFEAIEDYACAYLIFTVKTTLLFANYSIRVDSILKDLGNMPLRDNDFFKRDPRFQEAYSRHAHIIDFDMLRLGKKMIEDNPKARRLSFGTFVVTEIDKEFKNTLELKEMKMNEKECNQKNDLHNACLMMCRHAAVVANRVFIRIICDLQRPEAWGAGGRELGEVVCIADKSDLEPALPFCSPYWLCETVFSKIRARWQSFYASYIHKRSDRTLFVYLVKNLVGAINNHYDRVKGLFGVQTLKLEVQSGRMDGEPIKERWRVLTKKDRSRRYPTACLEAIFESYTPNTMHVDDFISYAGELGTQEENALQNSFFQNDIRKMKGYS